MMTFYIIPPLVTIENTNFLLYKYLRDPGIEPGSIAWKETMLTFTPSTLLIKLDFAAESFNFLLNDDDILYNTTTR